MMLMTNGHYNKNWFISESMANSRARRSLGREVAGGVPATDEGPQGGPGDNAGRYLQARGTRENHDKESKPWET
jgi:hypothetical protein